MGGNILRDYAFDLFQDHPEVRIDIDNGTRTQDTVIRVSSTVQTQAKQLITQWLQEQASINVVWGETYGFNMFHLDEASRSMTNKFEEAATQYKHAHPLKPLSHNHMRCLKNATHGKSHYRLPRLIHPVLMMSHTQLRLQRPQSEHIPRNSKSKLMPFVKISGKWRLVINSLKL
jgi:hypothetical protein